MLGLFYVASVKHTKASDPYITFWRPENAGYAYPLPWSGKYTAEQIKAEPEYYNSGCDSIAVACASVNPLGIEPWPGKVDGDVGPVVQNTAENWARIYEGIIFPSIHAVKPEILKGKKLK